LLDTSTTPPTLLDVIGYSTDDTTAVTAANGLTAPTTLVEGTHVVLPADGGDTLARSAGFVDTGDNRADVCTQGQSPGAANADCWGRVLDAIAAAALGVGLGAVTGMPIGVVNVAIVDAAVRGERRFATGIGIGGALADAGHAALAFI